MCRVHGNGVTVFPHHTPRAPAPPSLVTWRRSHGSSRAPSYPCNLARYTVTSVTCLRIKHLWCNGRNGTGVLPLHMQARTSDAPRTLPDDRRGAAGAQKPRGMISLRPLAAPVFDVRAVRDQGRRSCYPVTASGGGFLAPAGLSWPLGARFGAGAAAEVAQPRRTAIRWTRRRPFAGRDWRPELLGAESAALSRARRFFSRPDSVRAYAHTADSAVGVRGPQGRRLPSSRYANPHAYHP